MLEKFLAIKPPCEDDICLHMAVLLLKIFQELVKTIKSLLWQYVGSKISVCAVKVLDGIISFIAST